MLRSRRRTTLLLAFPLAGAIASCSDPSSPPPVSVTISPASANVIVGQTHQFSAAVLNATNTAVQYSVSAPTVVSIDANGLLRALSLGSADVIARSVADPTKADTAQVTVIPVPIVSVVVTPGSTTILAGTSTQLSASPRDANGNVLIGRTVTWSSSNSSIASVSGTGVVTGHAAGGPVTITATGEGVSGTATVMVTADPCRTPQQIQVGQQVSNALTASDCRLSTGVLVDYWQFRVESLTTVQIDLGSTAFDSYLILMDSNGNTIAQDDDSGPGLDSRISRTLAAGTYTIQVRGLGSSATGNYTLSVNASGT